MDQTDDSTLLRQYVEHNCEKAFAALAARHVNLVYSVALRQAGDPLQAEEITQAVFIVLAGKAGGIREPKALSSWLFRTTRLTAMSFITKEHRRQRREQEAHLQSTLDAGGDEVWPKIAPLLDDAVARLNEKDRHAIMLRFYESRNLRDVAQALGASEDAAEKRVSRAVEKLRRYFSRHGIDSTAAVIAESLWAHSVQAAPMPVAKIVAAAAAAKAAAAGGSSLALAKATFLSTKSSAMLATAVAVALAVGTGVAILNKSSQPAVGPGREVIPVKLANDAFAPHTDSRFIVDTDPATRRTSGSMPAGHIRSLVAPVLAGSGDYLASLATTNHSLCASCSVTYRVGEKSALRGQRIRISGWIKAKDVRSWVGTQCLDTGFAFHGSGKVWIDMDSLKYEIVN
jgi:RNA polymerase sigma factor (sigma-70 family)